MYKVLLNVFTVIQRWFMANFNPIFIEMGGEGGTKVTKRRIKVKMRHRYDVMDLGGWKIFAWCH